MRISDWSSDVCSSDLFEIRRRQYRRRQKSLRQRADVDAHARTHRRRQRHLLDIRALRRRRLGLAHIANDGDQVVLDLLEVEINCRDRAMHDAGLVGRSEEHTSELQSLMRISYAVFCLKKNKTHTYHSDNKTQ